LRPSFHSLSHRPAHQITAGADRPIGTVIKAPVDEPIGMADSLDRGAPDGTLSAPTGAPRAVAVRDPGRAFFTCAFPSAGWKPRDTTWDRRRGILGRSPSALEPVCFGTVGMRLWQGVALQHAWFHMRRAMQVNTAFKTGSHETHVAGNDSDPSCGMWPDAGVGASGFNLREPGIPLRVGILAFVNAAVRTPPMSQCVRDRPPGGREITETGYE
jgi:hypothetical protein